MWHSRCEDTRKRLDEYVAATLPGPEVTRVRAHLDSCARCAHAAAVRRALRHSLSSSSPLDIEVPSGFRQALLDRLATASAEPNRAPVPRRGLPQPSVAERLGEWWDRARWTVAARPVATLAVSVVAVVLAIMAAQVVGTRHDPSGVAFPRLENNRVTRSDAPSGGQSVADAGPLSLPPAPASGTGTEQSPAPLPSHASEEGSVATLASLTLAAVSPDVRSVVPSDGIDVVAAFDGLVFDPRSARVTMRVDDIDVTGAARVTPEFVAYTPATRLTAGTHVVSVDVADPSGARRTLSWEFYVLES